MGADHPFEMVLLILICLFGIAISTKGTSFTIETNYLSNFLQFDSKGELISKSKLSSRGFFQKTNELIRFY